MKGKLLILFLFIFRFLDLASQKWTNFNLEELGLSTQQLYDLDIDSEQNIWVASQKGLLKYDGKDWKVFDNSNSDLPHNKLFSVAIDSKDRVWVGHTEDYGVSIYDGNNWINYNKKNSPFNPYEIRDIVFDKNDNPWFGTWLFLWSFQDGDWYQFKHREDDNDNEFSVYEVEVDKNNDIWFTTGYNGMYSYSDGKLENFFLGNNSIHQGLSIDSNNNIWVFNSEEILVNMISANHKVNRFGSNNSTLNDKLELERKTLVDKNNIIWIIEDRSLHKFNLETEEWQVFTAPDSLFENSILGFRNFKFDKDDNFWFITRSDGAFKLSDALTNVADIELHSSINIYPNPSTTQLSIETDETELISEYVIINSEGKIQLQKTSGITDISTVDISSLSSGVYFLQLIDRHGTKLIKKFIVE